MLLAGLPPRCVAAGEQAGEQAGKSTGLNWDGTKHAGLTDTAKYEHARWGLEPRGAEVRMNMRGGGWNPGALKMKYPKGLALSRHGGRSVGGAVARVRWWQSGSGGGAGIAVSTVDSIVRQHRAHAPRARRTSTLLHLRRRPCQQCRWCWERPRVWALLVSAWVSSKTRQMARKQNREVFWRRLVCGQCSHIDWRGGWGGSAGIRTGSPPCRRVSRSRLLAMAT